MLGPRVLYEPLSLGGPQRPSGPRPAPGFHFLYFLSSVAVSMYLLYVDSSGTPETQDHSTEYVLVGVAVQEGSWVALDRELAVLKKQYALDSTGGELHAKDFCVSIVEQDEAQGFEELSHEERRDEVKRLRREKLQKYTDANKRRSKEAHYRRTEPFLHLSRRERSQLLEDALDLVGRSNVKLFGEAIRKADAPGDVVVQAFQQIVSRFEYYLEWRNSAPSGHINKGLLIMDQEGAREASYRSLLDEFRKNGHPWGALRNVIEAPFFVDSSLSGFTQLADVCAYAVRRYLEKGIDAGSHEERNFLRILSKFDRSGSRLHGLRHYCTKGTCPCLICKQRGHAGDVAATSSDA